MGYFFRFWYRVIKTALYIIFNRKRETRRAYALLDYIETQFDGKFVPATRRKIAVSYGIYTPMICDAFTALHGRRTVIGERVRYIHYFVCSSLFDDFTDTIGLPEQELLALSFDAETFTPRTFDEAVFRSSHLLLRDFVKEGEAYGKVTRALFQAQWDSKKQARGWDSDQRLSGDRPSDRRLSDEEIRAITFSKGGNSVLLCSYYLEFPDTPAEKECWYRIGTIIQLTNDLFDIYKDIQDHIDTLPTRMTDVFVFQAFFGEQIRGMQALIHTLPVPEARKAPFRLAMAGIYAFGLIALDQLREVQGDASSLPPLATLPRSALIIDMEKRKNLAKWLRYTYHHARL
jgi:hypothetical protein